jgi:hypothetical protein
MVSTIHVDWGDGQTGDYNVVDPPDTWVINQDHHYDAPGSYTIAITGLTGVTASVPVVIAGPVPVASSVKISSAVNATALTIARPSGVLVNGDLLVAVLGSHSGSVEPDPSPQSDAWTDFASPGFSRLGPAYVPDPRDQRAFGIYARPVVAAANEPGSFVFTRDEASSGRIVGAMFVIRGAGAAQPGGRNGMYAGTEISGGYDYVGRRTIDYTAGWTPVLQLFAGLAEVDVDVQDPPLTIPDGTSELTRLAVSQSPVTVTNLATNPGLEGGSLTGWASTDARFTIGLETVTPIGGARSAVLTRTAAASDGIVATARIAGTADGARIPVSPDIQVTASIDVRIESTNRKISAWFEYYNSAGTLLRTDAVPGTDLSGLAPGQVGRAMIFDWPPANTASIAVKVEVASTDATDVPQGERVWLDNLRIDVGSPAEFDYFDGRTPNAHGYSYAWTAAPDASTSTRTGPDIHDRRSALWVGQAPIIDSAVPQGEITWRLGAVNTAAESVTIQGPRRDFLFASVADMAIRPGYTWAYRGNSTYHAEMSLYAYDEAAARGHSVLEVTLARTSDGVWFGLNDDDINRTSGGGSTFPLASGMTWAEVSAEQIVNSADGIAQPYLRAIDLFNKYGPTHILVIDPASVWSADPIDQGDFWAQIADLPRNRVIIKGLVSNTGLAAAAKTNGYDSWGYASAANATDPSYPTWQTDWTLLGLDIGADQATWDAVRGHGKPVVGHVALNQADYYAALAKGADGVLCGGSDCILAMNALAPANVSAAPPPGSPFVVPEGNSSKNPSVATLNGFAVVRPASNTVTLETTNPISPPNSAKSVNADTNDTFCFLRITGGTTSPANVDDLTDPAYKAIPMVPGNVTAWSATLRSDWPTSVVRSALFAIDAAGVQIGSGVEEGWGDAWLYWTMPYQPSWKAGEDRRIGCTYLVPPGAVAVFWDLIVVSQRLPDDPPTPAGTGVWVDDILIDPNSDREWVEPIEGPGSTPIHPSGTYLRDEYADGDTPGYHWAGTPGLSATVKD